MESKETQEDVALEKVLDGKIAQWEDDRCEQRVDHAIKLSELITRIAKIKKNGRKIYSNEDFDSGR